MYSATDFAATARPIAFRGRSSGFLKRTQLFPISSFLRAPWKGARS